VNKKKWKGWWSLADNFYSRDWLTTQLALYLCRLSLCITYLLTYLLTYSWSWALLEEPTIQQLLKNFPAGLFPCSQEPSSGPYPEPDQSNPSHPIISLKDPF
jgi:hypothetical protein